MRHVLAAAVTALAAATMLVPLAAGSRRAETRSSPGTVAYRLMDGDTYLLAARAGAQPVDMTKALDHAAGGSGTEEWLNISPDGKSLLTSTTKFGCGNSVGDCLAVFSRDLSQGSPIKADGQFVSGRYGAVANGGRLVVYASSGGPHSVDLWAVTRSGSSWASPRVITGSSAAAYNEQPAISSDGTKVLFDCGKQDYSAAPQQICEVGTGGGPVTVVVHGGPKNALHHADFGAGGSIVFEGDWTGERVWRLAKGAAKPVVVGKFDDDNSPCVLPDGRIVSLWLGRKGNPSGKHEIKVMRPNGSHPQMLLTGHDVLDVGTGCGA